MSRSMFRKGAQADAYAAVKAELRRMGWRLGNASAGGSKVLWPWTETPREVVCCSTMIRSALFRTGSACKDTPGYDSGGEAMDMAVFLAWTLHIATAGQPTHSRKTGSKVQMHVSLNYACRGISGISVPLRPVCMSHFHV